MQISPSPALEHQLLAAVLEPLKLNLNSEVTIIDPTPTPIPAAQSPDQLGLEQEEAWTKHVPRARRWQAVSHTSWRQAVPMTFTGSLPHTKHWAFTFPIKIIPKAPERASSETRRGGHPPLDLLQNLQSPQKNEVVGPLVQKSVQISRRQQQNCGAQGPANPTQTLPLGMPLRQGTDLRHKQQTLHVESVRCCEGEINHLQRQHHLKHDIRDALREDSRSLLLWAVLPTIPTLSICLLCLFKLKYI